MTTSLTVYGSNTASTTLSTANKCFTTTSGSPSTANENSLVGTKTGYGEVYSQGNASTWAGAGSIGSPSGHGFLLDVTTLEGNVFDGGTWTTTLRLYTSVSSLTTDIIFRAYVYNSGTYTAIGSVTLTGQSLTTTQANFTLTSYWPITYFGTGDKLYLDVWCNITVASASGSCNIKLVVSGDATKGITNNQSVTPGYDTRAPLSASANLLGAGASGSPALTNNVSATLSGSAALQGPAADNPELDLAFTATLSAQASLPSAQSTANIAATLTGTGSLPTAQTQAEISAAPSGGATLKGPSTTPELDLAFNATLAGQGAIPTANLTLNFAATLSGSAAMQTAQGQAEVSSTLTGTGAFAQSQLRARLSATLTGQATLTESTIQLAAVLSGSSSLSSVSPNASLATTAAAAGLAILQNSRDYGYDPLYNSGSGYASDGITPLGGQWINWQQPNIAVPTSAPLNNANSVNANYNSGNLINTTSSFAISSGTEGPIYPATALDLTTGFIAPGLPVLVDTIASGVQETVVLQTIASDGSWFTTQAPFANNHNSGCLLVNTYAGFYYLVSPPGTTPTIVSGAPITSSSPPGHDSATDIRITLGYLRYKLQHPSDTQFDTMFATMQSAVLAEWSDTNDTRGFIYFLLNELRARTGNGAYYYACQEFVENALLAANYDPIAGMFYSTSSAHSHGYANIPYVTQLAAACIHYGYSFFAVDANAANYINAGINAIAYIQTNCAIAYTPVSTTYTVLPDTVYGFTSGPPLTMTGPVYPGANALAARCILAAYEAATVNQGQVAGVTDTTLPTTLLNFALALLDAFDAVVNPLGLWDTATSSSGATAGMNYYGYFQKATFNGTGPSSPGTPTIAGNTKENGRQQNTLEAYHLANLILGRLGQTERYLGTEALLVATYSGTTPYTQTAQNGYHYGAYQPDLRGIPYNSQQTWFPRSGITITSTSEAMGIGALALLYATAQFGAAPTLLISAPTMTGRAALTQAFLALGFSAYTLTGQATFTAQAIANISATLTGTASLGSGGVVQPTAVVAPMMVQSTSTLTATAQAQLSATLTGLGTLTVPNIAALSAPTMVGQATLSTPTLVNIATPLPLVGQGSLTATAQVTVQLSATLTGQAVVESADSQAQVSASLSAQASVATAQAQAEMSASLQAQAVLTATNAANVSTTLSGQASLTNPIPAFLLVPLSAPLTGQASLTSGTIYSLLSALLAASATLTPTTQAEVSATLAGISSLPTAQLQALLSATTLSSSGNLSATATESLLATLAGSSTITASALARLVATLSASATVNATPLAAISAPTMSGQANVLTVMLTLAFAATLSGRSMLTNTVAPNIEPAAFVTMTSPSGRITMVTEADQQLATQPTGAITLVTV